MVDVIKCDCCREVFDDRKKLFRLSLYKLGIPSLGNKLKFNKHICKECSKRVRGLFK